MWHPVKYFPTSNTESCRGHDEETTGWVPRLMVCKCNHHVFVSCFCLLRDLWDYITNSLGSELQHWKRKLQLPPNNPCNRELSHRHCITYLSATFRAVCRKRAWSFSFRLCSACVMRVLERSRHWRQFAICWASLRSFITWNTYTKKGNVAMLSVGSLLDDLRVLPTTKWLFPLRHWSFVLIFCGWNQLQCLRAQCTFFSGCFSRWRTRSMLKCWSCMYLFKSFLYFGLILSGNLE